MMLGIEDVLCELATDHQEMNGRGMPPGFRFHPTDEELITFYLASKVFHGSLCSVDIAEVDLNKCEPWDLPDVAKMGKREWYIFSLRDRKYPTGLRTNRATGTGYWKATGKDKEIHNAATGALIGMKKTLVFYLGRAPRGEKTKWVMHEYRLHGNFFYRAVAKDEWVICRIHHKASGDKMKNMFSHELSSQFEPASTCSNSVKGHESFLPALIESQLDDGDFIQNQTSKFSLFPSYNFSSESYCSVSSIGTSCSINPSTSALSSMFIKSPLSPLDQQQTHNLGRQVKTSNVAEQMKTEASLPIRKLLTAGGDATDNNLEWFHELQQASSHLNPFFSKTTGENCGAISANLGRAGFLQTMVDPSYKIPTGESSWALLDA